MVTFYIPQLSRKARKLLLEAAEDRHRLITVVETDDEVSLETNRKEFVEAGKPRSAASKAWL